MGLPERQEIEELLKSGVNAHRIAITLQRSHTCILREVRRCPEGEYNALIAHEEYRNSWRDGRKTGRNQPISKEKEDLIHQCMNQGISKSLIRHKISTSQQKLDEWFETNAPDYCGDTFQSIEKRITNLELQFEILIDQLKELKNDQRNKELRNVQDTFI
jgi:IS30 family transposase